MSHTSPQFPKYSSVPATDPAIVLTAHRNTGVGSPTTRDQFLPVGQPHFGAEEIAAVTRVLQSGRVGMGPETLAFERELADACGARHVVTVNSCTSALFLSLLVHGVGLGDEVIVPSLTWISAANAALHAGATPVFCDVDPYTLCATPESIRERLTPRTRAVVVVHLGGHAVDMDAIRHVIPAHIPLIEDAAHAFGARYVDGAAVGGSGNLACFSFYANKNLSTGDGGAIALNDDGVAERQRSLRQHALASDAWRSEIEARTPRPANVHEVGYKMNLTDLQASIGRVQLRRQREFAERRRAIATLYLHELAEMPWTIAAQWGVTDPFHARHLFLIQLPIENLGRSRDEILNGLRARNVGATVHYTPLHHQPLYRHTACALPVTDDVATRVLTLPISASMTLDDARDVRTALERELSGDGVAHASLMRRVG